MIEDLKRIETMMRQEVLAIGPGSDQEGSHIRGDYLLDDLAVVLSQRCYDEEKQAVERIRSMYAQARENWWYA